MSIHGKLPKIVFNYCSQDMDWLASKGEDSSVREGKQLDQGDDLIQSQYPLQ